VNGLMFLKYKTIQSALCDFCHGSLRPFPFGRNLLT
jgi:hypothetical protein